MDKGNGSIKRLLIDVLLAVAVAAGILAFIRPTIVNGVSMEPTLHSGDYMIVARQAYIKEGPARGDIVIAKSNVDAEEGSGGKRLIKRVIGLPGDSITIIDAQLYINGEKYVEEYIKDGTTPAEVNPIEGETVTVPEGCYYILGDNRWNSMDSRSSDVGFVNKDDIDGKVIARLLPINRAGTF